MAALPHDVAAASGPAAPLAAKKPSQAEYFGTVVSDPYAWMERADDPSLATWLAAQDRHTRAALAAIPQQQEIYRRVESLSAATVEISKFARVGNRYFYLKRPLGANRDSLYVREGVDRPERVLLDGNDAGGDPRRTIDFLYPSHDGKRVAFLTSIGGSEKGTLQVVDVEQGVVAKDMLERVAGEPQWSRGDRVIFYAQLPELPPGAPPAAKFHNLRTYRHVIGAEAKSDVAVLGTGVASSPTAMAPGDFGDLFTFAASPWLVARITREGKVHGDIYAARGERLGDKAIEWRKVADVADAVTSFDAHGDDLYLLTNRDGEGSQIVRVDLSQPTAASTVVVPASERVLMGVSAARDALYVRSSEAGTARLQRITFSDRRVRDVALPFAGAMAPLETDASTDGVLFKMQSWVRPPAILAYEPGGTVADTGLLPSPGIDVSRFEAEEVTVPSVGGAAVPLSIVHARGLKRDGSAPTWLSVYGSHGTSLQPRFEPRRLAWLERGGIYAVCHARGGGERGEPWHLAAMKQNKQRSIDDAVACARYLAAYKYTSPAHLAIEGTSAGGLAAGGALTQHPELFGAAILRVPVLDPISFEASPAGPANTREFGSMKVREEAAALLAISPYHHVRDGVPYPAVLLMTALNDRRVPISQAAKMAARLQAASTSGRPVLLRVESDAGHGIVGTTRAELDRELADIYAFLSWQLDRRATAKR